MKYAGLLPQMKEGKMHTSRNRFLTLALALSMVLLSVQLVACAQPSGS
jgi:hypothetical protein